MVIFARFMELNKEHKNTIFSSQCYSFLMIPVFQV